MSKICIADQFEMCAFACLAETNDLVIWVIQKYVGGKVTMQKHAMGATCGEPVDIDADQFLSSWKLYKGAVTAVLPGWSDDKSRGNPLDSTSWKLECAKGAINLALRDVYQSIAASSHNIDLFIRPNCAKVKHDWAAGEFMVAPATYRIEGKDGPAFVMRQV